MRPDACEAALADVGEAQEAKEAKGYGMVKKAVGFSRDACDREGLPIYA
jgi:hypothetical protein